jgi:uncharacterized protein (DUF2236 family)
MLAASMLLVPRQTIPPTVPELRRYLDGVVGAGILRATDSALRVASLFEDPPADAEWRPVLRIVSKLAFGTLPAPVRELYGYAMPPHRRAAMAATFAALRRIRPMLPERYRYIAPYQDPARGTTRAYHGVHATTAAPRRDPARRDTKHRRIDSAP